MSSINIYSILSSKPHNPHYLNRYWKFIQQFHHQEKIKGATEYHHICPKSKDLFPEYSKLKDHRWNGIHLTFRQHFIAHHMLAKAYGGKQIYPFWAMVNKTSPTYKKAYIVTSAVYSAARELYVSNGIPEETRQKLRKPHKNPRKVGYKTVPCSEEKKLKISVANTGSKRTPDQRSRMSASRRGKCPWNKGLKYSTGTPSPLRDKKSENWNENSRPQPFLCIIETKKTHTKTIISRKYPELKRFY